MGKSLLFTFPLARTEAHGQMLVQRRLRNVAQFTEQLTASATRDKNVQQRRKCWMW